MDITVSEDVNAYEQWVEIDGKPQHIVTIRVGKIYVDTTFEGAKKIFADLKITLRHEDD